MRIRALAFTAAGLVLAAAAAQAADTMAKMPAKGGGDAALIASAQAAAPMAVSKSATIAAMSADGKMRVVRKGTNGFTCMPDVPATPGPDPMCFDQNAGEFIAALQAKKPPAAKTGFIYMLAGGTDASNTDPYAAKPTGKNHWIKTGPHVMIVGDPEMLKAYPSAPDPNTAAPYVMWAGTPYAHLMVPVK
jgi:hypothetical protein